MGDFQFREDDKQEGDILKLVLLGLDICASFLLTIISLSKHVKGSGLDLTDEAFASVGVFSIVGAIYASVISGYYCCKLQQKTCSHGLLIGLGGLFYYMFTWFVDRTWQVKLKGPTYFDLKQQNFPRVTHGERLSYLSHV